MSIKIIPVIGDSHTWGEGVGAERSFAPTVCCGDLRPLPINALPNGLICLKGGELEREIGPFRKQAITIELADYFKEPFFETKKVVYVPL